MTLKFLKVSLLLSAFNLVYSAESNEQKLEDSSLESTFTHSSDYLTDFQYGELLNTGEVSQRSDYLTDEQLSDYLKDLSISSREEKITSPELSLPGNPSESSGSIHQIEQLRILQNHLASIRSSDVHSLDSYVMAPNHKARVLVEIGRGLNKGEGTLSLSQVGDQMREFINFNSELFEEFTFDEKKVPLDELHSYITKHFNSMDNEITSICPEAREIWSRFWTLAKEDYIFQGDLHSITTIYNEVCENYLTGGGCIQGRINRGFKGYIALLTYLNFLS